MTTTTNTKQTKMTKKVAVIPEPEPEPIVLIEDEEEEEEEEEEEDEAVIAEREKDMTPEQREATKAERAKRVKKPALSAKHRNLMAVCHWFVSQLCEEMRTDELLAQLLIKADLATQTAFYSQFNAKDEVKIVKNIIKPPKVVKPRTKMVKPTEDQLVPAVEEEQEQEQEPEPEPVVVKQEPVVVKVASKNQKNEKPKKITAWI